MLSVGVPKMTIVDHAIWASSLCDRSHASPLSTTTVLYWVTGHVPYSILPTHIAKRETVPINPMLGTIRHQSAGEGCIVRMLKYLRSKGHMSSSLEWHHVTGSEKRGMTNGQRPLPSKMTCCISFEGQTVSTPGPGLKYQGVSTDSLLWAVPSFGGPYTTECPTIALYIYLLLYISFFKNWIIFVHYEETCTVEYKL